MLSEREGYIKALEILDKPEKWTKGTFARDESNNGIPYVRWAKSTVLQPTFVLHPVFNPKATCFCLSGALIKVHKDEKLIDKVDILLKY